MSKKKDTKIAPGQPGTWTRVELLRGLLVGLEHSDGYSLIGDGGGYGNSDGGRRGTGGLAYLVLGQLFGSVGIFEVVRSVLVIVVSALQKQ